MISKETEAEIVRLYHGEKWPIGTIASQLGLHHTEVVRQRLPLAARLQAIQDPCHHYPRRNGWTPASASLVPEELHFSPRDANFAVVGEQRLDLTPETVGYLRKLGFHEPCRSHSIRLFKRFQDRLLVVTFVAGVHRAIAMRPDDHDTPRRSNQKLTWDHI